MKCRRKGVDSDWALRNVDLNVRQGELFGLLGPNGAGKTTMIGLLSGILDPTSGDFFSSGLDGKYESGEIRKITNVCPQFDILWAELTIYDHIKMICEIKGLKKMKYREFAIELMNSVNLVESLDERISSLSGGMRRRVSIALATIGDPKVKPTSPKIVLTIFRF
jgi:ABC-2 type transport system ATP-binding protein